MAWPHIDPCPLKSTSYKLSLHLRRAGEIRRTFRTFFFFFFSHWRVSRALVTNRRIVSSDAIFFSVSAACMQCACAREDPLSSCGKWIFVLPGRIFVFSMFYCHILIKIINFVHARERGAYTLGPLVFLDYKLCWYCCWWWCMWLWHLIYRRSVSVSEIYVFSSFCAKHKRMYVRGESHSFFLDLQFSWRSTRC